MIKQTKILVTGAAGFMGSHTVDWLLEKEGFKNVYGLDNLSGGYLRNVNKKCKFTKLDLRNKKKTAEYIKEIKAEIIFHLAADATEGRSQFTPLSALENNYQAFLNLLVPAINCGMKKIIITSSMSVYGGQKAPFSEQLALAPEDIYAISKTAMEKATQIMSQVHSFKYVIIRPHNVYGPKQNMADPYRNVVAIFINCLLRGRNFYIYGDGTQKRAFTYIDDFTPYFIKAGLNDKFHAEIFNIGPREEYSLKELAETVLTEFFGDKPVPKKMKPKYLPSRPQEVKNAFCTSQKAEKLLGYKTKFSLREGVAETIKWARTIGPQRLKYLKELEITKNAPVSWRKKLI